MLTPPKKTTELEERSESLERARDQRTRIALLPHLSCVDLAKMLLGMTLCRDVAGKVLSGVIVETEAYLGPEDRACHSSGGRRSSRNEALYMKEGTCYVYIVYGIHHCFNISSREPGAGVLVRALQPLCGLDLMRLHRESPKTAKRRALHRPEDIANGPAKLCVALRISKTEIDREDLLSSTKIWLEEGREVSEAEVGVSKRIGLRNAGEWGELPLRFYIKDTVYLSCRRKRGGSS